MVRWTESYRQFIFYSPYCSPKGHAAHLLRKESNTLLGSENGALCANKTVPTKANGGLGLIYRLQFAGLRAKNVPGAEASLSERHILSAWAYSLVRRHRNMYHSNTILHTPPRAAWERGGL